MKKYESILYSTGGIIAVFVILVLANFVLGALKQRADLTDGKIYTLSRGTEGVLSKLEAPVKIRFYYTQNDANVPLPLKTFARRVEDLLAEFRQAAGGKVLIEKLDPQPDSDAEDSAALEGIEAQETAAGDRFYLGLSVSYADRKLAIPALNLDRERLLEYDIVRSIVQATQTAKSTIGVMSPMPLFGSRGMPAMGMGPQEKQVFISELERDFNVKRVGMDGGKIDDDIKLLVVVNPRGIGDQAEYAIDQFVLRGGKLIAMVDPYAFFDQLPGQMAAMGGGGGTSSSLDKLFKAWGIGFDSTKVLLDMKYVSGAGPRSMPTVLSLVGSAFDPNDVSTSRLGLALIPFTGAFTGKPAPGLKETVLMKSSNYSQFVDAAKSTERGEAAVRGVKPSGVEHPLAIKLTGRFKTAFPGGKPKVEKKDEKAAKGSPDQAGKAQEKTALAPAAVHLSESKGDNAVVLIGDSDFINDGAAVDKQEIFGQRIIVPSNGNLAFAQALVEQLTGDPALIELRSRATAVRPFTVIREMEAKAQQNYLGKLKVLEDGLQQTQEKLQSLQKTRGPGQSAILSPEQQAELDNFRKKAAETRRELKEVRKELRADSEALQFWTKVTNIAGMPVLVALAGILFAVIRRRKVVAL